MNSSPFSPEALGTLAALASGVVALGTAVYRGMNANDAPVPANGTVPVPAPVVPVGVNQITPPTQAPAIMPMAAPLPPALALSVPPPPPPAPMVLPAPMIVLTLWAHTMTVLDRLIAVVAQVPLNMGPLVDLGPHPAQHGPRVKGTPNPDIASMSHAAMWANIVRVWNKAHEVGSWKVFHKNNHGPGVARADGLARVKRSFKKIPAGGLNLFHNAGPHQTLAARFPLVGNEHIIPRANQTTKLTDFWMEVNGMVGDTKWIIQWYVLWFALAFDFGATNAQANYLASAMTMNIIFVHCGINPKEGIPGFTPSDFGHELPADWPTSFQLRP